MPSPRSILTALVMAMITTAIIFRVAAIRKIVTGA
jgi:hypothetical protein